MLGELPRIIAAFVSAKNGFDSQMFVECFTAEAIVYDEGQELQGHAAIKKWIENSNAKYQDTISAIDLVEQEGETVLTANVAGNFPGSPVSLDFHFRILDGRISRLQILPSEE
jgi:hypothetical protein